MHVKPEPEAHLPLDRNIHARLAGKSVLPASVYSATYAHTDLSALLISHGHLRHRRTNVTILLRRIDHQQVYGGSPTGGRNVASTLNDEDIMEDKISNELTLLRASTNR